LLNPTTRLIKILRVKKILLFLLLLFSFYSKIFCQILIPNIPDVTLGSSVGLIKAFEFDSLTNKLYIVGQFDSVGTVARKGFAVIDITTGAVLNDFNTVNITNSGTVPMVATMKIFNQKLYIGGLFKATYAGITSAGSLFTLDFTDYTVTSLYSLCGISDFKIYNNKIYTTGAYYQGLTLDEYMVSEMDTMGNVSWQKSISNNSTDHLTCLDVRNNNLFVGGSFSSFDGKTLYNIAKVDLGNDSTTSWQPSPQPGNAPNTCYGLTNLLVYPNDVLLNIDQVSCASPTNNLSFYDITSGALNNQYTKLAFQADYRSSIMENDTSFWYFDISGLRLHGLRNYISAWSPIVTPGTVTPFFRKSHYLFVGGDFTTLESAPHSGLGIYCLAPNQPIAQTFFSSVCRQQNNVVYSVIPDPDIATYTWSYTGSGVSIADTGSIVNLNFSATATSGTLNVSTINSCGTSGPTLSIPIIVNPLPNANAGPDIRFTCSHKTDTLYGSSLSPSVHYDWAGPFSYSNANATNQVLSSVPGGNYSLTVTYNSTGCASQDIAKILYDTLQPVINHLTRNYLLTCKTNSLTLDATGNYPVSDILHWSGPFSFSQNNPAHVTNTGTYFLNITSGTNGCKNKDSVTVTQNNISPDLSLVSYHDTITCLKDSIQLQAISTNTNTILYWKHAVSDSLLNNSYANQPGVYFAHAIDTSNGCTSQTIDTLSQFTTPPVVHITSGNYQFNCSYSTITLNDTSLTPGATVHWTGPSSFSSANPATINQQGTYTLTATNPQNGCTAKDTVNVTHQNVLILNTSANTIICNGSSTTLTASPIGGTPGFTYSWNNSAGNSHNVIVYPIDTTIYIVTVTDNAGCVGIDSVKIIVPAVVSDSIVAFIPCDPNHPNGQIQAFASGGIPYYTYSLNNGMYQPSGVFPNLNFGTYTVSVRDARGCSFHSSKTIDSLSLRSSPDFILSTNETKGDTFVIVDISNPRPDSVSWILPTGCQIINNNSFTTEIINSDTGALQITMIAWFGTCQMSLTKNIHIFKFDTSIATNYNNNGIKSITLYPNPNTGHFTVDVSLYKAQTFVIFVIDALGQELLHLPYNNLDFISAPINISNPIPGTYLLKVIAEYDSQNKSFLITP